MDAEISAMVAISEALEPLDAEARTRVLQWAGAKYSVKLSSPIPDAKMRAAIDRPPEEDKEQLDAEGQHFETFADLYAATQPSRDSEKVLVAAYWHQVVKGQKEVTSAPLNKDLTDLGHRITNINNKFDSLIGCKPQLALQVKKSGSAKQARKKYKLTQAGIAKVQGMLGE